MADLRAAKIVAVHRKAHAVDIVYQDDRSQVPMVQISHDAASSRAGRALLLAPTPPPIKGDVTPTKDQDVLAIVGTLRGGVPIILGFYYPQVSQMMFDRENFLIDRHPSDVYHTLDDEGNFEFSHPSGTFVRIAEEVAHEDLSGLDFDKKFKVGRNTDKLVNLHLVIANGGAVKADILIDPNGKATITLASDLVLNVTGNVAATVSGNLTAAITGNISSSAAGWTHTGPVTFASNVTMSAALNVAGTATAAEMIGGGKHLSTHTHADPQGGNTAPPT
jgi:hypothetical protein